MKNTKPTDFGTEEKIPSKIRHGLGILMIILGPVSLIASPLPVSVASQFFLLGIVPGVLWSFRDQMMAFVAIFIVFVGVGALTSHMERSGFGTVIPEWQPTLLTFSAMILTYYLGRFVLRRSQGS